MIYSSVVVCNYGLLSSKSSFKIFEVCLVANIANVDDIAYSVVTLFPNPVLFPETSFLFYLVFYDIADLTLYIDDTVGFKYSYYYC